MAKSLVLEFGLADGKTTQMTLDDDLVKQDLLETAVRSAMESMVSCGAFATTKGVAYNSAISAYYVERTATKIFDDQPAV